MSDVASNDRLSFTLFIACIFHGLLFSVPYGLSQTERVPPTLNITLATHKSELEPDKADFLAQHNQQASGTEDKILELTTREQAEINALREKKINPVQQQRARQKQDLERQMLATTKKTREKTDLIDESQDEDPSKKKTGELMDAPHLNPETASLYARLYKTKQEYANKPKTYRLTSVATKTAADARYLNNWQEKVEYVGNKNFPKEALNKKIFGNLRLAVIILPSGRVDRIEILKSSGHSLLDTAAIEIVKMAEPFAAFPPEFDKDIDKLEIIRTWRFEIDGLTTTR